MEGKNTAQISVVVITYNEEEMIDSCLKSIFDIDSQILRDVVLVDSNSTDNTVEIASRYPIKISKITDEKYMNPAAGRNIGAQYAQGEYILFVDGDMMLKTDWISSAIKILNKRKSVAGVSGYLNDNYNGGKVEDAKRIKGVMLFRQTALRDVGSFNPSIEGAEDYELCYRLRDNGYKLVRLPTLVAEHEDENLDSLRRLQRGYFFGTGQIVRQHITTPWIVLSHLNHIRKNIISTVWILLGVGSIAFPLFLPITWILSTGILSMLISKRSNKSIWEIVLYLLHSTTKLMVSIIGFIKYDGKESKDVPSNSYKTIYTPP